MASPDDEPTSCGMDTLGKQMALHQVEQRALAKLVKQKAAITVQYADLKCEVADMQDRVERLRVEIEHAENTEHYIRACVDCSRRWRRRRRTRPFGTKQHDEQLVC